MLDDNHLENSTGSDSKSAVGHHFPVPGTHAPCEHIEDYYTQKRCGSTDRNIEHVPANRAKKLVCGKLHLVRFEGDPFIPGHEFDKGGAFENIIPAALLPPLSRIKQGRWKPSSATAKRFVNVRTCARPDCGVPHFNGYENTNTGALLEWINTYVPELKSAIGAELSLKPGMHLARWFAEITEDLQHKITVRADNSIISLDHGITRKAGNQIWYKVSRDARKLMQDNLVFPICKHCNLKRGSKPLDQMELLKLYVDFNYDGSIAAAKADLPRWEALNEILSAVYAREVG